ncbi:hypothetical protein G6F32_016641 [Rhizopus arrhizus]|nr:hypothetical protein G6F32_016641 [Rhizopus arrhizus]
MGHQLVVGLAEQLHRGAERFAQAGHFHGAGGDLRRHVGELAGFGFDAVGEPRADAFQQLGRRGDQRVYGRALFGGRVVHGVQQRVQPSGAVRR